jgi:periplasmic divalent cation tolerance protein
MVLAGILNGGGARCIPDGRRDRRVVRCMAMNFCYVTADSRDEALTIGRAVVEERLAACANVLDGLTSIYWWQGALEQAGEAVLILKTRAELVDRLTSRIRELHSYECPCVVALPIDAGNPAYLDWIARETGPA